MDLCTHITCTAITQHLGTLLMSHEITAALLQPARKGSRWGWAGPVLLLSELWHLGQNRVFKQTLQRNSDPELQSQKGSYLKFCPNHVPGAQGSARQGQQHRVFQFDVCCCRICSIAAPSWDGTELLLTQAGTRVLALLKLSHWGTASSLPWNRWVHHSRVCINEMALYYKANLDNLFNSLSS